MPRPLQTTGAVREDIPLAPPYERGHLMGSTDRPPKAAGYPALLAAIRDALSPPPTAEYDGIGVRDQLLVARAAFLTGVLNATLDGLDSPSAIIGATRAVTGLTAEPLPYTARTAPETPAGGAR
jgi:hypothetical protein